MMNNLETILRGESVGRKLAIVANALRYKAERSILKREHIVRTIHGNRMLLPARGSGVTFDLAVLGNREELETEVFRREVSRGMTVVDLGANIGYYTLLSASLVGPEGKVYAIEPFPGNFQLLTRNVALNGFSDIVDCTRLAISDRQGTTEMFLGDADNLHTLVDLSPYKPTAGTTITVETQNLDGFLEGKRPADFLRMDIEGAECQVFDGMEKAFGQKRPPKILFEVHPIGDIDPDPRFTPRLERLRAIGYRPKYVVSSSNPLSLKRFRDLGYTPTRITERGHALFENVAAEHLIDVAARRPKITRAILLTND